MDTNYIALAVPIFFLLIALELWVARRRGLTVYRLNDSIADLSTGTLQQFVALFFPAALIAGHVHLFSRYRVVDLGEDSVLVWVACFVAVDFCYYWFHRLSHEVNFLWAAHAVHHQSEEYNLTVALRQSTLQGFFAIPFYLPLALLGFSATVTFTCSAFHTLYQFWIHTRLIGSLGPLENVLMTPSHHRVHHGRNPIYIDRNHGGSFIFWDKLFGTFEPESEEVAYGVTTPLASWNPLWANAEYWVALWRSAKSTMRWRDKVRVFLKPPGWFPEDLGGFQPPPPVDAGIHKYDTTLPPRIVVYALVQFVQMLALNVAFAASVASMDRFVQLVAVLVATWGLLNIGGLFDGARWSALSEWLRVAAMPVLAFVVLDQPILAAALAANLALAFWADLDRTSEVVDPVMDPSAWRPPRADER